jgi:hypothetical protein
VDENERQGRRMAGGGAEARRQRDGERRRTTEKALGCTNRRGNRTRTTASGRRTRRWASQATGAARRGGRREGAAAELRRGRLVGAVHGKPNKPHQEVPYLTAKLRSGTTGTGRRQRRSSTAARHGIGGSAGDLGFGRRVKTARVFWGAQAARSVFK